MEGTIAGTVSSSESSRALPNVTVDAVSITTGRSFRVATDPAGSYVVRSAPSGLYAFTLRKDGIDYVVPERLDVRVGVPFLLESCFVIDDERLVASVSRDCASGLVEPSRVATIGPHRFLVAPRTASPADLLEMPAAIEHGGIECLTREHYPLVDAGIRPGTEVRTSRVYFRSDKHPDFYYVEMSAEHPTVDDFQAVLPKPGPETERVIYHLESIDSEYDSLRTAVFDPEVLETEECERRGPPAWSTGEPSIVVGSTTPGAAAIPPGFQAAGITGFVNSLGVVSAVGGSSVLGSMGILIVSGAAAAGGTIIVVTTGENEASPP